MPVRIYGDLNARVSHLLFDVRQGSALLNEKAPERVLQIVEADPPQAGFLAQNTFCIGLPSCAKRHERFYAKRRNTRGGREERL